MPMAPDPSFGLGWKSGDQADEQQARAAQQRSYLEQVLANTRTTKQQEDELARQRAVVKIKGTALTDPSAGSFADGYDPLTDTYTFKDQNIAGTALEHGRTTRTRTERAARGKSIADAADARYLPDGDLAGQPIPAEVSRRTAALRSGNFSDEDLKEMNQFGDPNWNKSPAERKLIESKREAELAKAESDKWTAKHLDIGAKSLPLVSQYLHEYGDGVTLRTLDMDNPAHRQLKIDAMVWAREQMKADDPARATLTETIRHHKATEAQKDRELHHKESTEGVGGGKPLPAEATKLIMSVAELGDAVVLIDRLRDDPKSRQIIDSYLGPYASKKITAQTLAPQGSLGPVPPAVVQMQQNINTLKNAVIQLRTGAAMSVAEAERIMKEIPDMNLPPDQFWARYDRARTAIAARREILQKALLPGGDRRSILPDRPAVSQPAAGAPPSAAPTQTWTRDSSGKLVPVK